MELQAAPAPTTRRANSRKGCFTCRRNKKKCNEGRPRCSNCARKGVECVYPEIQLIHYNGFKQNTPQTKRFASTPVATTPGSEASSPATLKTASPQEAPLQAPQVTIQGPQYGQVQQFQINTTQSALSGAPMNFQSPHSPHNLSPPKSDQPAVMTSVPMAPAPMASPAMSSVAQASNRFTVPGLSPSMPRAIAQPRSPSMGSESGSDLTSGTSPGNSQSSAPGIQPNPRKGSAIGSRYALDLGTMPQQSFHPERIGPDMRPFQNDPRLKFDRPKFEPSFDQLKFGEERQQMRTYPQPHKSSQERELFVKHEVPKLNYNSEMAYRCQNQLSNSNIINEGLAASIFSALDATKPTMDEAGIVAEGVGRGCYPDILNTAERIDLRIRPESLLNAVFMETAAVTMVKGTTLPQFVNLPSYVSSELAQSLFGYFVQQTAANNHMSQAHDVHWFNVCYPLVFSNSTVFKALLLYALFNFRTRHNEAPENFNDPVLNAAGQNERFITTLHTDILVSLKEQMMHHSSVACDHSLMVVLLLCLVEIMRMPIATGLLYKKLVNCAYDMLHLRGGVEEVSKTMTGRCLTQSLLYHFAAYRGPETVHFVHMIPDPVSPIREESIVFHDELTYVPKFGFRLFQHIATYHLQLEKIYYELRTPRGSTDSSDTVLGDALDSRDTPTGEETQARVRCLKSAMERAIYYSGLHEPAVHSLYDPGLLRPSVELLVDVETHLTPYQIIHGYPATLPIVAETTRRLTLQAEEVLEDARQRRIDPNNDLTNRKALIWPFIILGVYQVGDARPAYRSKVLSVYNATHNRYFKQLLKFLDTVWSLDNNGTVYIDWLKLLNERDWIFPLYS